MRSSEIRKRFLRFFENKEHSIIPSDLLVPRNDPTLLFTGAGMNQFKEQFMGKNVTFKRAASSQKCLRTGDVDNVGRTPRHHTFFEMLGNFSFGDYFKKEAIQWAWEFMTEEVGIPGKKLWISVYENDDETYHIWKDIVGIPEGKIVKMGPAYNFWPADAPSKGPNGPCGPCSEIFYDWGKEHGCGGDCNPSCDCGRFVEVWNLVFTESERQPDGTLKPLPEKNIDTGMGLERIAAVLQGVYTNFDTDLFTAIIGAFDDMSYGKDISSAVAKDRNYVRHVVADHIRAVTFAVCDGVSPSNEKRGYVVRKLIRRAYSRSGMNEPFLYKLVPVVTASFDDVYPELKEKSEHIAAIVKEEENKFQETLATAMPIMNEMLDKSPGGLSGENIFKLVDTYGLPVETIKELSSDGGFTVDMEEFEALMEQRKEMSRKGSDISNDFIFKPDNFKDAPRPGYSEDMPLEAELEFILKGSGPAAEIAGGDNAEIIISPQSSVLYASSGGQTGDRGIISSGDSVMDVLNTVATDGRKILQVRVAKGSFKKGDRVVLELDIRGKERTACNHTATHLLQAALRSVLGEHVKQSGSYVDSHRLRFDFTHMKKLSEREIIKIEKTVNNWIDEKISVAKETKSIQEARAEGALSFFGDKYGQIVRVVTIGDRSKELCGGTHVDNTGDIGLFKITAESSIASGIRRIEAVTGEASRDWIKKRITDSLEALKGNEAFANSEMLERSADILSGKIAIDKEVIAYYEETLKNAFAKAKEKAEKEARKKQKKQASESFSAVIPELDKISQSPSEMEGVNYFCGVLIGLDVPMLKKAVIYIKNKISSGVILLGAEKTGKAYLTCAVTGDLLDNGVNASEIIRNISAEIGGSGGGKPDFAQAGGKDPSGLESAVKKAGTFIKKRG